MENNWSAKSLYHILGSFEFFFFLKKINKLAEGDGLGSKWVTAVNG